VLMTTEAAAVAVLLVTEINNTAVTGLAIKAPTQSNTLLIYVFS
jgi:hypothetical protein